LKATTNYQLLSVVGFGLPQCLLLFRLWAYGRGVGGAWSTTTSVLGVKKQHFSLS